MEIKLKGLKGSLGLDGNEQTQEEKNTFNNDDKKGYFIDKGVSYIVTTSYTSNKIDLSDENRDHYWQVEEPRERYFWLKKRKKEKKGWKDLKEIIENKSGLASIIPMNAFDGVKEIKYLESRGTKKRIKRRITGRREKRNNEESSRSEEDRNSNNSMTEQRTSRNRRKELRSKSTESKRFGVKGPRSSRILRGVWIKRESIRENSNELPSRKTFFSLNELDELLDEKKKDGRFYFSSENRRKSNSSIIFGKNNEFRLFLKAKDRNKIGKIVEKSDEAWNKDEIENLRYKKESSGMKENRNLTKSIKSSEIFQTKEQRKHKFSFKPNDETKSDSRISEESKFRIFVRQKEDENKIKENKGNSFYVNGEIKDLRTSIKGRQSLKEYVKSLIRNRRNVDKFSKDATVPYPTKETTIKLKTGKVEKEASVMSSNRGKFSKDTVGLWYEDNSKLEKEEKEEEIEESGDAIEIRLGKKTENKEVGTMRKGKGKGERIRNLSRDKIEKERNETAYLDLNSVKEEELNVRGNVSKEKQAESKIDDGGIMAIEEIRSSKEFSKLTGHFDLTERSRNYLKEEGQGDTFSREVTNVTEKEMRNESLDLKEKGKNTIHHSPPINYLEKEVETVKIVPSSFKRGREEGKEKEVRSGILNVTKGNTVSWNSKEYRKYDTSDSDRLNSSGMSILKNGTRVQSFKDFQRNVRDPLGDFVSPRPLDYPTSHFPKDTKGGELKNDPSNDWKRYKMEEGEEEKENEKEKRRYHEKKIKSKDSQRKLRLKGEEQMIEDRTTSFNDFPKLTPLTFPSIISDERKETLNTKNREVSDYKKDVKTTMLPEIENKFTSSFPPSSNSISYKIKEIKQGTSSNVKEQYDIEEESIESSTFFSKKKRSKSSQVIENNTDPTTNFSTNSDSSERRRNQLDGITMTEETFETYLPRGNSMETTDISMTEESKRTNQIPNSFTDRSFPSVEIEGFTYPLVDVVTSQWIDNSRKLTFPSTTIDTVTTTTSIEDNTSDKKVDNMTGPSSEWTTVSWEKTTTANISVNKQSINEDHNSTNKPPWPVKHSAVVEGDLVLGGLMMVHEREDSVKCGPIMPQGGVQALEAMLYTLDTLNQREIVPGVKIGAHILDDCDKDTYGLEMAVDFIKDHYSLQYFDSYIDFLPSTRARNGFPLEKKNEVVPRESDKALDLRDITAELSASTRVSTTALYERYGNR
ncbi:hypothetical protein M0802_005226 [Mischocyttarus mexicanus]|nr:hypothetical protein M0802_005226 [Mischocyttarus mexicanus]